MTQPPPRQEMEAYDRLPKTLRQALRESGEQFSAAQLFRMWRSGRKTCAQLVAMIQREDKFAGPTPARRPHSPKRGLAVNSWVTGRDSRSAAPPREVDHG